jgi:hypothetical protein
MFGIQLRNPQKTDSVAKSDVVINAPKTIFGKNPDPDTTVLNVANTEIQAYYARHIQSRLIPKNGSSFLIKEDLQFLRRLIQVAKVYVDTTLKLKGKAAQDKTMALATRIEQRLFETILENKYSLDPTSRKGKEQREVLRQELITLIDAEKSKK